MKIIFFLSVLFLSTAGTATLRERHIQFDLILNKEQIELGKRYFSDKSKDSISIDAIRFYISDLELFLDEKPVYSLDKKHHLIDLEYPESLQLDCSNLPIKSYNKIKFNLGIDSTTNVSGAMGGDLDPSNGMYWAWQSGYINFKLEGISPSCPARHNRFAFHLGGYQNPFYNMQKVELLLTETKTDLPKINLDLDDFFNQINLKENHQIMSPSKQAVEITALLANAFYIQI